MGRISVAAFKPKAGKQAELLEIISERLPLLRRLGLCTDRPDILMRSREGVIIQVSEWTSDEAIAAAHATPEVHALWERFAACSEFVRLEGLAECRDDFATFDAVE